MARSHEQVAGGGAMRVVVVGAGIAGLTAAFEVLRALPTAQVTVLESADQVGGKLRLSEVAGRPVDVGAEAILNRRPEGVGLAREVGLGDAIVHPETTSAGIWTRGAVRPLPPTIMGVPTDLAALRATGIIGAKGMARARMERVMPLLPPLAPSHDISIGELVSRRLGPEVRDRLVEPLLGGVYAGRADDLSLRATVPHLAAALGSGGRLAGVAARLASRPASGGAPDPDSPPPQSTPVFAGVDGGVGRLAGEVAGAIEAAGGRIRTGATVREVVGDANGFGLVVGATSDPERIEADAVVMAAPAVAAARLLRAVSPQAASELAEIEYASIAIVTLAFDAESAGGTLTGSGFLVPPVDGKDIKAATFSSRKWAWMDDDLLLVRCSIGRIGEEATLQRDDVDLVGAAVSDLREAVGVAGPLAGALVTRWGGALPQYRVGHGDRVRRIRDEVDSVPGLAVCGAAYDGLGIPACIASARAAATRVVEHLQRRGRLDGRGHETTGGADDAG